MLLIYLSGSVACILPHMTGLTTYHSVEEKNVIPSLLTLCTVAMCWKWNVDDG